MKKLLMVVGMMLAAVMAAWADRIALPKEAEKTPPATIEWGEAVDGVQIGLVPLGGDASWVPFFQCPRHARQRHVMPSPQEKEKAIKTRCCELCGAPKPWGATFVEGEPMRFEVHMRNTGDKGVRVGGVHHWFTFVFTPAGGGVPRQAIFTPQVPMAPPGGGELPGNGYLAFVEGVGGNSAYGSWRFEDARPNRDKSLPSIPALPPGKYSVTARYGDAHPEHTPDAPCRFWHGKIATGPVEIRPPHSPTPVPILTVSGAADAKANSLQ